VAYQHCSIKKVKSQTFHLFPNSSLSIIPEAKYCGRTSFFKARMIYTGNFHTKASNTLQGSSWNDDNCSFQTVMFCEQKQFLAIHRSHGTRHLLLMAAQALNISHVLQTFLLLISFLDSISLRVHFQAVTANF
jgi:hypothetical protein